MPLRRLSIREIQSRPARSFLTLLSIVGGVAAIVATYLASESAQLAQIALVRAVSGNAALEIEGAGGASFDGKPLEPIAKLAGVAVASPVLRRYSNMTLGAEPEPDPNKAPAGSESEIKKPVRYRVQLLGVVPELDQQVRGYKLVSGENLNHSDSDSNAVLMDEGFARSAHVTLGSEVRFLTRSYVQTGKVVGLIKPSNASAGIQSGLIVAHLTTVQRWSRANGKLDAVQIVLDKNANLEKMTETIKGMLSEELRVAQPQLRSQVTKESLAGPQLGLLVAMVVVLILSVMIIYNTFQMNVGERRRTIGILRAMGTTRKQVLLMIVREGMWLGVVGTFLGCIIGPFGATAFRMSYAKFLQIEIPASPFSIWPYLLAGTCGVTVSLVGAFLPALFASRLSPSEAMRMVAKGEFATNRTIFLQIGSLLLLVGLSIQTLALSGVIHIKHSVPALLPLTFGAIFLIPAVIGDLTLFVERLFSFFFKTEGMLARRQILRHRGRSSLTIGIIFIAMGGGLGLASTILDNVRNIEGWYSRAVKGDFFIRAAMPDMNSGQAADMPDGLTEKVTAMQGVELVDSLRFVRARSNENSVVVVVRKFNSKSQEYFDLIEGHEVEVMAGIHRGEVVLGSVLSQRLNIHVGDTLPLETKEGATTLRVVGVTNEYIAGGLTIYLEASIAKKLLDVDGTDVIVVKAITKEQAIVEQQLRKLCDETGMMFQSNVDLLGFVRETTNGMVGGLWVVLAIGSVVAAFGLINTLAMNILEQTREIGMLRVVAMTRQQVRKMILAQAFFMGVIGVVPGVLIGLWIALILNLSTQQATGRAIEFGLYPWLIVCSPLLELLVVVVAALIPAERAARVNISSALQYE